MSVNSITVIATQRRDSNGNTEQSINIIVDGILHRQVPKRYGYGTQYLVWAMDSLKNSGIVPKDTVKSLYAYCQENNIALFYDCITVTRQKDMI